MSYPGEGERDLLPVSVPELSDMIVDFIHAPCNPTILVIHPINATSCHIRPAPIYAYRPPRYLSKGLFVDHREISIRILRTAQELRWSAVAVYIAQGIKNATLADKAVKLHDRSWFTKPERIATLRARLNTLLLIPGRPNGTSISPTLQNLRFAGDKMLSNLQRIFMRLLSRGRNSVMIKALGVTAPSTITSNLAQLLPAASTTMAGALRYQGVGAFACLVNSHTGDWVLLEINPRYAGRGAWCLHRAARRARRHTSMRRSAVRVCEVQCVGTDSDSNILVGGLGLQGQQGAKEVTVTLTSASGSGSLTMKPETIFHLVLSKAAVDKKKHTLRLTSIAHNTFTPHHSATLQTAISPLPLPSRSSKFSPPPASVPVLSTSRNIVIVRMPRHR
ncbi:hypothetical protein FIBSPDRAFT_951335 [Athelia psychrophila]|uniref:ATP-grasp domain-containing protein n=1 Tax=Athelia psychrophila TaxID=1759441 RepID=A0A166MT50_9AGAM|nr:hypothetical protein FIBSPDRAFT_951335 [Fibularhizoctonia sp. CBS 109695]